MLTALTLIVLALTGAALILLGLIVLGIRQEPRGTRLSDVAPSPMAAVARRLVGLYIRRPGCGAHSTGRHEEGPPGAPATRPAATTRPCS